MAKAKKQVKQQPPRPAAEPRRLGVITIIEDGTVITGNITQKNALTFAQILAAIQNQILGIMQSPENSSSPVGEAGHEPQETAQET